MYFEHLRKVSWYPTFEWVGTRAEAANKINLPHEDYPKYVDLTDVALHEVAEGEINLSSDHLRLIHRSIFIDKGFAGKWREVDVRVGMHHPPKVTKVSDLMDKLEEFYIHITNVADLIEWYTDFETIHPFQDGNGRVGGVIVAAYSHKLRYNEGWYATNQ